MPTACAAPAPTGPSSTAAAEPTCDGLAVIRFSEHLCPRLRADSKRITLRARHRTAIKVGQWVQLVCMESRTRFRARITLVRHTSWRGVTDRELADDGFSGRDQLLPIMRRYYPGIVLDDPATVYRWDRARPCGSRP
jgi:hypothetical protein